MNDKILAGVLLDEESELSLSELIEACSVSREWVIDLVEEGILEPIGEEETQWCFSGVSLSRVRSARRLQQDLELNLAGVALALELLDEIQELRAKVHVLESQA